MLLQQTENDTLMTADPKSLVENQVYLTEPIFMEWKKSRKTEAYKKTIRNFTIFMILLLAGAMTLLRRLGMAPAMMVMEATLFIGIYVWLVFGLPRSQNKRQYKAICQQADGTPERFDRFYADSFTVTTDSGEVREFFYDKVEDIQETEHLYVINIADADVVVLLDKNGFLKGDIEEVKKLCNM